MVPPKIDGSFVLELKIALANAIYSIIVYVLISWIWCQFNLPTNAYRYLKFWLGMKKVFVFCIGGTGIRVMKSITMLMAGGMDTNGYMVVPVIIDPHLDLEEKKNLHSLLDSYINIYQQSINNGTSTLNHLDGFFNSEIRLLSQLNNQSNDTQQVVGSKEKFGSYIKDKSERQAYIFAAELLIDDNIHKGHRERMKKRFSEHGLSNFSPHEVIEMLL